MGRSERKADSMPRRVLPFGAFLFGLAGVEGGDVWPHALRGRKVHIQRIDSDIEERGNALPRLARRVSPASRCERITARKID